MLDVTQLIESGGLLLIGFIIFAESGLLLGFFLPGDTLLFTAGFFAAQGKLPLGWLLFVLFLTAFIGYEVGYRIGQRFGRKLFNKPDGLVFRQEYLARSEAFYEHHGGKTIMLSRFVPIVRTFAPVIAGISAMPKWRFTLFNAAGGLAWTVSVTLLGYWLGSRIPDIDRYLLPIVGLAMFFTFAPTLYHLAKDKQTRQKLIQRLKYRR